jgi:Glycine zipper
LCQIRNAHRKGRVAIEFEKVPLLAQSLLIQFEEGRMKKVIVMLAVVAGLAGCTNAERGAVVGGAGGAALGTLAGGNDVRNAIVGGAVGAIAGTLIGASADRQGYCRYRDQYGRIYEAPCS